ncbi:MAG: crotonase/enoyl-CoA hydratase family protein [Acidimicrobiales bacterium]
MYSELTHLDVRFADHVAHVRLDRADKHNALNGELMESLRIAATRMAEDDSVRVVVLSGAGPSFCSGLDTANIAAMASGDLNANSAKIQAAYGDLSYGGANRAQQVAWLWRELRVPVIAAVHGSALGGGLNLALGADIRVVAPNSKLAFVEIDWGLIPDMSASQGLRHVVGADRAKLLVLTGERFDGEQALAWGLATETSEDPVARALDIANRIAAKNPDAVRAALAVLNLSHGVDTRLGFATEAELSAPLIGSTNQVEAVMARLEKRAAEFEVGDLR